MSTKLIVIGGPTATGKTKLAIEIAKQINGEIINADSVQVYKYLNIGSNKGNINQIGVVNLNEYQIPVFDIENSGIKGYLFNLVEPNQVFTLAHYQKLANAVINHITLKNKIPILVGGTGLYIDAVIKNYQISNEDPREDQRAYLNMFTLQQLQEKLKQLNPSALEQLNNSDRNNPRRLIRLIEKARIRNLATVETDQNVKLPEYDFLFLYPEFNRDELNDRINKRVVEMFNEGLVNEVKDLYNKGFDSRYKSMQSLGYAQVLEMIIKGNVGEQECIEKIQLAHRQYAKRQITWFEAPGRDYKLAKVKSAEQAVIVINAFFSSF